MNFETVEKGEEFLESMKTDLQSLYEKQEKINTQIKYCEALYMHASTEIQLMQKLKEMEKDENSPPIKIMRKAE